MPYYYTGDGNMVAYYRIGNEFAPAPVAVLNELLMKGLNQTFDALETKYSYSDYSYTKKQIPKYINVKNSKKEAEQSAFLRYCCKQLQQLIIRKI